MAKSKAQKTTTLAAITQELKSAKGIVFTQYRGLTVKQIDLVRKILRKENVKYQVVKITLLKKALQALGIKLDNFKYNGPVALATSVDEEAAPARILKSLVKDNPQLVFDGGVFNQEIVGPDVVLRLASLATKPQLLGQLVSVLTGPARGLVTVLSGNTKKLLNVLNAIKDVKGRGV
ncbi:MAG: 50S ribosomal protein L10 [Candidatus Doudnabacteria bacterium RIFCSPLOWO2_01_FULL_44_21]|uniref:Large ribosomal subunit protein uL10 n=1 Tax=Candidatus Doudnabacteria bacterium RIFCSPLOWO2_01_FULL_44_21 TaxID=1817841 RepID=A0A1F5PXR0_9BACT|nr:MAG: 50S ribosomal protein L10 [Candidatus Doudnabacteria bacterium RIFCSPHIGHO2_02_FULL_43_13b]OGE94705.1 MAG: 50S ribosomal protein L10 [Candidatus Doudnabacteria bacterium RIFCSPLOWO2_01_FULL_44_21]